MSSNLGPDDPSEWRGVLTLPSFSTNRANEGAGVGEYQGYEHGDRIPALRIRVLADTESASVDVLMITEVVQMRRKSPRNAHDSTTRVDLRDVQPDTGFIDFFTSDRERTNMIESLADATVEFALAEGASSSNLF